MKRFKPQTTPATEPVRKPSPEARLTLLVVDDEPSNVLVLERIFEPGYRVLKAGSGHEALALMRAHRGDDLVAILSDQRMPGMTGVELLARAAEERPEAARVLVTGYSDMDAIVAAINQAHVMHYVSKPYEPETIRQVVRRAVEERERRRELRAEVADLQQRNRELAEALARTGSGGK
jgi:response regulator RpfG family c-di-GMP phosphodiesterase